jgi:hypothetical protein
MAGKNAQEGLSRFVEGGNEGRGGPARPRENMDENRRSFWDDFSGLADQGSKKQGNSAIGTSAMGMGKGRGGGGPAAPKPKKQNDDWDDW